jgi:ABC-2 type transport system ATP-binding protein
VLVVTLAESCPDLAVPGTELEGREANVVRLRFNRRELTAEALIRRVTERYQIVDVAIVEPDIESIVRRIYLEGYHDGAVGAPS